MVYERIKSAGLAHNSYFLGSGGEAVVIDPRRDCRVYLELAERHGLRIKRILETHRNEDYVVGSRELSRLTGAEIHHGPRPDWQYGNVLADGEEFRFGRLRLTVLRTPGHTDESLSYVLADLASGEAPVMVFTGDALFVDEVGRTDLYGREEKPRLAAALYGSIFDKLLPLGDGVILCPAHGAGSVCGANIGSRDESTLGIERLQNPVLRHKERGDFIRFKTAEEPERPSYFAQMERYNLGTAPDLGELLLPPPLTPAEFRAGMEKGAMVIDTSQPVAFGGAHIKGALSIWLEGLPGFAGWLLSYDRPVMLVLEEPSHLDTAVRYLARIGYDRVAGYLRGGIEGWANAGLPVETLRMLSIHELKDRLDRGEPLTILDVRGRDEWQSGHLAGAINIYVGHLADRLSEIPADRPVAVMCSVGHRATVGASLLLRAGYREVVSVIGSFVAWKAAGFPVARNG